MKRIQLLLCAFVAMLMLSVNSVWAQYVKLTAPDGTESWIEIEGVINGTNIEIYKDYGKSAINQYTKGSIDLNEVWSESDGSGTHYQVTSIGIFAFSHCSGLTSVFIPSSVTSIGICAFWYCFGLTSITMGNGMASIGNQAFHGCSGFTSIDIPSSVTSIGSWAFLGCSGLTSIEIPSSVTSIGNQAFRECSGLTSIVVESGNTIYDSRNNCNAIIEKASNTLIAGCKNTKIPSNVTSIGSSAFFDCYGLTSIVIPSNVISIEGSAFFGCTGLTSIVIPSSVTSIESQAFYGCSGLTSITSYITEVFGTGNNAFRYCDNATLYVPHGLVSTYRSTADWNSFNKIEEIPGIALAMSCNNKGKVTVNGGIQFTNDMGEVSVFDGVENTFVFQPNNKCELRQVLIDGLDVTLSVENNQLTTKVHEGSKMIVMFDKTSSDVNGDGQVDISDVVRLVNIILGQ
ncbi:MAG: leucine-rich repeat protein [Bacteroidaceae bacterium]|nr:leucine-rich repeat protein [Bacteroidaceae bacterium]